MVYVGINPTTCTDNIIVERYSRFMLIEEVEKVAKLIILANALFVR